MIQILGKSRCCGCTACSQICPKQCITMESDLQGFLYPIVNTIECIGCNLCEKVCPVLNQSEPQEPLQVYAAKNCDEQIRENSSSGGIFTSIAECIIKNGGVVFGATFNEYWEVRHIYVEAITDLSKFRGSKYVQSNLEGVYQSVKSILLTGRQVLFSGTPCQIAGLRSFLREENDNLFTVDIVCHGVPSPLVWNEYLNHISAKYKRCVQDIVSINFRNKEFGWYSYRVNIEWKDKIYSKPKSEDLFMLGFLKNLYLRPSCEECPVKSGKSGSDITLGDFWGVNEAHPEIYDDKGVTMVLLNTKKGQKLFDNTNSIRVESTYGIATRLNPVLNICSKYPDKSEEFWQVYKKFGIKVLEQFVPIPKKQVVKRIIREFISRLRK